MTVQRISELDRFLPQVLDFSFERILSKLISFSLATPFFFFIFFATVPADVINEFVEVNI